MKKYLLSAAALMLGISVVATAAANPPPKEDKDPHKVYVCKYVGTPGAGEVLQTGQNPIEVDSHALEGDGFSGSFPFEFSDAQGKSVAIGWSGDGYPVLGIGDCPGPDTGTPDCSGDFDPSNNGPNGDCTTPRPRPGPRSGPRIPTIPRSLLARSLLAGCRPRARTSIRPSPAPSRATAASCRSRCRPCWLS